MQQARVTVSATDKELRAILGPEDEALLPAIRRTRASPLEVIEAFEWLWNTAYMAKSLKDEARDRVMRVYDILKEDRAKFRTR